MRKELFFHQFMSVYYSNFVFLLLQININNNCETLDLSVCTQRIFFIRDIEYSSTIKINFRIYCRLRMRTFFDGAFKVSFP